MFTTNECIERLQLVDVSHLRFSLIQSFSLSPGSSIQLARLRVSMEPSIVWERHMQNSPYFLSTINTVNSFMDLQRVKLFRCGADVTSAFNLYHTALSAVWVVVSVSVNRLTPATYMPRSSRWTLPQHHVRDGTFRLVAPFQRRCVVQSKVTVREQQRIKEHRHGIGRPPLQPLAQVLQILQQEVCVCVWGGTLMTCQRIDTTNTTERMCARLCYLLQQRQVGLLLQFAVQQGVRV